MSNEHLFEMDLTMDEVRRRAHVLEAIGDGWEPGEVLRGEREAYALLYSGLAPSSSGSTSSWCGPVCFRTGSPAMLPLDPFADPACRARLACPNCDHGRNCPVCQAKRTRDDHWQYLLGSTGRTFTRSVRPACTCGITPRAGPLTRP